MIRAIRTNMVNRAMLDRGQIDGGRHPFFYYWCEKAAGGFFRGADVLAYSSRHVVKKVATRLASPFWKAAVLDWAKLGYAHPPAGAALSPHREHAGSYPALAAVTAVGKWDNRSPAAQLLINSSLIYLSDFWNYSRLQWCTEEALAAAAAAAQPDPPVSSVEMRRQVYALQRHAFRHTPQPTHVVALEVKKRAGAVPMEKKKPQVGEVWADPTTNPITVGIVTKRDESDAGPLLRGGEDRNGCGCMDDDLQGLQGDCVWLAPVSHQAGFGALPPEGAALAPTTTSARSSQLQLQSLTSHSCRWTGGRGS
jgi:hypothetical protein